MSKVEEIIYKVFNDDSLNSEEEQLLLEEFPEVYQFYCDYDKQFDDSLLVGLKPSLVSKIKEIKSKCVCSECGNEYRERYIYLPYCENDEIQICSECIRDISWDYVALKKMEKYIDLAKDEYEKMRAYGNNKVSKALIGLGGISNERERIGEILSELSINNMYGQDRIDVYYCIVDDNKVRIMSDGEDDCKLKEISDIDKFSEYEIEYDADCMNIKLRYEEYIERPYYIDKRGSYNWIVPKGYKIKLDSDYYGDYEDSEIDYIEEW